MRRIRDWDDGSANQARNLAGHFPTRTITWLQLLLESAMLTDEMADTKDLRIPVTMAATEVAAIDDLRSRQPDLSSRSAIRRLVELGLKAKK